MRITIIDVRDTRRERLAEFARRISKNVHPVPLGNHIAEGYPDPDLVLMHVGPYQEDHGDSIEALLQRFQKHSWILCYYGGEPVEAATQWSSPSVAVFPAPVDEDDPGQDLERAVLKVLALLADQSSLPGDGFRSVVTGFNLLLEAKLDVLTSLLSNQPPVPDHLSEVRKAFPDAFDDEGELRISQEGFLESVTRLRALFFHEWS